MLRKNGCLKGYGWLSKIERLTEYGGAPLLGINGVGMICHGGSNVKAIKNAIHFAHEYAKSGVSEHVAEKLSENVVVTSQNDRPILQVAAK